MLWVSYISYIYKYLMWSCVYVAIYLIFDIYSIITIDPDGVYERLGPELFKDWTFFRDMALFAAFLAFFTSDTHHYGTFDSVIEGMERLPADFIKWYWKKYESGVSINNNWNWR